MCRRNLAHALSAYPVRWPPTGNIASVLLSPPSGGTCLMDIRTSRRDRYHATVAKQGNIHEQTAKKTPTCRSLITFWFPAALL